MGYSMVRRALCNCCNLVEARMSVCMVCMLVRTHSTLDVFKSLEYGWVPVSNGAFPSNLGDTVDG